MLKVKEPAAIFANKVVMQIVVAVKTVSFAVAELENNAVIAQLR